MNHHQQHRAWKTLTHLLHEARHGRPVDGTAGLEMAQALAAHWPSFGLTLDCIQRHMRDLAERRG